MCKFAYGFSTGIPLNILIIYGKDPNLKGEYWKQRNDFFKFHACSCLHYYEFTIKYCKLQKWTYR